MDTGRIFIVHLHQCHRSPKESFPCLTQQPDVKLDKRHTSSLVRSDLASDSSVVQFRQPVFRPDARTSIASRLCSQSCYTISCGHCIRSTKARCFCAFGDCTLINNVPFPSAQLLCERFIALSTLSVLVLGILFSSEGSGSATRSLLIRFANPACNTNFFVHYHHCFVSFHFIIKYLFLSHHCPLFDLSPTAAL